MTTCRRCGAPTASVLAEPDGFQVVRCRACRTAQADLDTRPPDDHLYEYYEDRVDLPREEIHLPLTGQRLREVLDDLRPQAPGDRLLDVGCGEGQLVAEGLAGGWDARGIDLSRGAIAICERFGLPCARTDLFSDELEAGSFHLITMIELIEHVDDPGAFLRSVTELLAPGGLCYLTTPNFASLGRRILGASWAPVSPEHLWYLTPSTMRSLVGSIEGLEVDRVRTRNVSAAALRKLARRPTPTPGPDAIAAHVGGEFAAEQALRHRVERSPLLRAAKAVANRTLDVTGLGETMAAVLRKRA